jgi:hypothetical protein
MGVALFSLPGVAHCADTLGSYKSQVCWLCSRKQLKWALAPQGILTDRSRVKLAGNFHIAESPVGLSSVCLIELLVQLCEQFLLHPCCHKSIGFSRNVLGAAPLILQPYFAVAHSLRVVASAIKGSSTRREKVHGLGLHRSAHTQIFCKVVTRDNWTLDWKHVTKLLLLLLLIKLSIIKMSIIASWEFQGSFIST